MANWDQVEILVQGAEKWNQWRSENLDAGIKIDISFANLRGTNLAHIDLRDADISRVNFSGAYLAGGDFSNCNLEGADFESANLIAANLTNANLAFANLENSSLQSACLQSANLQEAVLWNSVLSRAILDRVNFLDTKLLGTIFAFNNLSQTINLDKAKHMGPSHISEDTIALSSGYIPEVFLRGCGLSDWAIESTKLYKPNLENEEINKIIYSIYDIRATQAIQISPLFISYSHGDKDFVDCLDNSLISKGIRFWRDIHNMTAGRMETQIDRAIRQNPTVLVILSKNSLNSDWVQHEVRKARELEREMGRDVLCPVALDNSWKSAHWPTRIMEQIMEYNILDFSGWEDEATFNKMFSKLISGLDLFYQKPEK